jgi:predicted nucleotidyltransferase
MKKIINEFVERTVKSYKKQIVKIILFGSFARGDQREDSDIDILVVVKGDRYNMLRRLSGIAFDLMLKYKEYISVKTLSSTEFKRLAAMKSSFIENVISEEVILYGGSESTYRKGVFKVEGSKVAV